MVMLDVVSDPQPNVTAGQIDELLTRLRLSGFEQPQAHLAAHHAIDTLGIVLPPEVDIVLNITTDTAAESETLVFGDGVDVAIRLPREQAAVLFQLMIDLDNHLGAGQSLETWRHDEHLAPLFEGLRDFFGYDRQL